MATTRAFSDGLNETINIYNNSSAAVTVPTTTTSTNAPRIPTQAQVPIMQIADAVVANSVAILGPAVGTVVNVATAKFKNAATNTVFADTHAQIATNAKTLGIATPSIGPITNSITNAFVGSLAGSILALGPATVLSAPQFSEFVDVVKTAVQQSLVASFAPTALNRVSLYDSPTLSTILSASPAYPEQSLVSITLQTIQAGILDPTASAREQFRRTEIQAQNAAQPAGDAPDPDFGKVFLVPTLIPTDKFVFKAQPRISTADVALYTTLAPTHMPTSFVFFKGNPTRVFNITEIKLFSRTFEEASENLRDLNKLRSWLKPYFGIVGPGALDAPASTSNQVSEPLPPSDIQTAQPKSLADYAREAEDAFLQLHVGYHPPANQSEPSPINASSARGIVTPLIPNNEQLVHILLQKAINQPQANDSQTSTVDKVLSTILPTKLDTSARSVRNQPGLLNRLFEQQSITNDPTGGYTDANGNYYGNFESPLNANISAGTVPQSTQPAVSTDTAVVKNQRAQSSANLAAESKMLGAPPMVLYLYGYSDPDGTSAQNINKIPVVLENLTYEYPNDVDYIPTTEGIPFPAIMSLTMTLSETHSPREVENFDIEAFKQGRMLGW